MINSENRSKGRIKGEKRVKGDFSFFDCFFPFPSFLAVFPLFLFSRFSFVPF